MNRFLQLVLAMGNARNGVILIDEIENGLHYSTHAKIWQILGSSRTVQRPSDCHHP
ncbi:MAG UNVERIFIED_CONTAM: ATP-binding protein [Anaerolineae bacterium]